MKKNGFKDVIGHDEIINYIQNAVAQDKVSHAYILSGERGSGKKLLAKLFAMTLQCQQKKEKEPCLLCTSCQQIQSGNNPDVIWVQHEKPNSIGVEDVREQLVNDVVIKPYINPYKIYIVPEADQMTIQAQNAILKTIEEPPAYAVLFLLAENVEQLLPTIQSRCVTLQLKNVKEPLIKKYLMEEYLIPEYEAGICASFSQGNVGKAIAFATSPHFNEIKEEALKILKYISTMEWDEFIQAIEHILIYKIEITDFLDFFMVWYRDVLLYKATKDVNGVIFVDQLAYLKEQASRSSYEGIENILKGLEKAKIRLQANVNFELVIELLLLTIKENS